MVGVVHHGPLTWGTCVTLVGFGFLLGPFHGELHRTYVMVGGGYRASGILRTQDGQFRSLHGSMMFTDGGHQGFHVNLGTGGGHSKVIHGRFDKGPSLFLFQIMSELQPTTDLSWCLIIQQVCLDFFNHIIHMFILIGFNTLEVILKC